jgi:hypothetical protein
VNFRPDAGGGQIAVDRSTTVVVVVVVGAEVEVDVVGALAPPP